MKVLEKHDYADWCHKFTCLKCESVLEADSRDVVALFHPAYDDQRDPLAAFAAYWSYTVKCEVCSQERQIDESLISARMKIDVQDIAPGPRPKRFGK